jgi:hypothetical protein
MQSREESKALCPLCGNTYNVTTFSDDGVDYMGHARGIATCRSEGECSCEAYKYLKGVTIKPMCSNCISYNGCTCLNVKRNEGLKRQLKALSIKVDDYTIIDTTTRCDFWHLNVDILMKYIKTSNNVTKIEIQDAKIKPKDIFKKHHRSR